MPEQSPAILVAAAKPHAAELAGHVADGLISTVPQAELVKRFEKAGGKDKPRYGQVTVCYAPSEDEAVRRHWPNAGVNAPLMTDLSTPHHFDKVIEGMRPERITEDLVLGADSREHIRAIEQFVDAGFDHVYVHQIGPNQQDFFGFYQEQVLPHFDASLKSTNGSKSVDP
jgi:G6PDH family F420-dependent oxidoreductase